MRWSTARMLRFILCVAFASMGCLAGQACAQELKYAWEPNQKFSYNMTITVEDDDKTTTFKGTVHYTVDSAGAEQMRVTYRGGLPESVQMKQRDRGSIPFGPPGFPGPPSFGPPPFSGGPFGRTAFAGKVQTTNRITLTPTGTVLAMEGDSQLPYLLGNVSLLPFEALPTGNERQWKLDSGVSITEEQDRRRPFGPFGPFAGQENKNVQAASEVTSYAIQNAQGDLVKVKKTYRLTTPVTGNGEAFDMQGDGVWTFNQQDHVPESLEMSYKLTAKEGNTSTTFPITVKYTRLSAAELAKIEADAKRQLEEHQRRVAAEKAKAETPLTADEKREALAALASSDQAKLKTTLADLEAKSLDDPDPQVAAAIERLVGHGDLAIAEAARKALAKWSPDFKLKFELMKAYDGPSPVKSTDQEVNSATPLYVGQIVQVQEHGAFWFPARVKNLLTDGKVEVEFMAWGKPNRTATLARRNLQLAPPELDQPAQPKNQAASGSTRAAPVDTSSTGSLHTWTDTSGRFKIAAEFVSAENGKVTLRRQDGREVEVPLEKLCEADRAHVAKLLEEAENPFVPK